MDSQCFFDEHAESWDAHRSPEEEARLARVVVLAEVQPGQAVLDVATGTGVLIPHLLSRLGAAGRVVATDLSPGMLEVARRKGFPPNVTFLEADVHQLPLPDADFDQVICNAALPHFEDQVESIREMARVLRPGGMLTISHPIGRDAVNARHRNAGGPVRHHQVPPPDVMSELLRAAGLTEVQIIDEPEFYLTAGRKPRPTGG